MIISRTPLRMSFVGGGSDLPVFYRKFGGAVVSTAIDRFIYVTVNQKFDNRIRISYSRTEEAKSIDRIQHPLVREGLKLVGLDGGIEITSIADIPSKGSGLGSSSSFTVGLLNALHAYAGRHTGAEQLAREACEIEIERCGEPIGKQDQYAAAFGGLNLIQFNPDDSVSVEPVICQRETIRRLQARVLVFYTGITRSASVLLKQQNSVLASERQKCEVTRKLAALAHTLCAELRKDRVDAFGEIIHQGWLLKKVSPAKSRRKPLTAGINGRGGRERLAASYWARERAAFSCFTRRPTGTTPSPRPSSCAGWTCTLSRKAAASSSCINEAPTSPGVSGILHEQVAKHVANGHVRVLHPAVMRVIDDNHLVRDFGHPPAFGADQGGGKDPVRFGPSQSLDAVGRVAAHAHAQNHVAGLRVVLQLPGKNILVRVIVR